MTQDYAALEAELHKLVERWRKTSAQAQAVEPSIYNLVARGHLQGVCDTFDVAAEEIETLLEDFRVLK